MGGSWLKYLLLIPLMLLTIPFVFCLLHNIIISCITSIWLSLQRKWSLELKQLIKCIVQYIINDCNSVTLEGNGNPLQYSCLKNPMDGGAWWAAVHGVAKSRTWLSGFTFTFHFHALEKEMATHSSVLAWRIPGTGESGRSRGSHRVRHDWATELKLNWSHYSLQHYLQ